MEVTCSKCNGLREFCNVGQYDGVTKLIRTKCWVCAGTGKMIIGPEINNGWTLFDGNRPPVKGDYYVCRDGKYDGEIMHSHEIGIPALNANITHWRPVVKFENPVY